MCAHLISLCNSRPHSAQVTWYEADNKIAPGGQAEIPAVA